MEVVAIVDPATGGVGNPYQEVILVKWEESTLVVEEEGADPTASTVPRVFSVVRTDFGELFAAVS